jgi:hypothetical protein
VYVGKRVYCKLNETFLHIYAIPTELLLAVHSLGDTLAVREHLDRLVSFVLMLPVRVSQVWPYHRSTDNALTSAIIPAGIGQLVAPCTAVLGMAPVRAATLNTDYWRG